jgi:ABC-type dipeptide/oligopeptide/nickel transport system permease component
VLRISLIPIVTRFGLDLAAVLGGRCAVQPIDDLDLPPT